VGFRAGTVRRRWGEAETQKTRRHGETGTQIFRHGDPPTSLKAGLRRGKRGDRGTRGTHHKHINGKQGDLSMIKYTKFLTGLILLGCSFLIWASSSAAQQEYVNPIDAHRYAGTEKTGEKA
jgi:hypothetical protein